MHVQWRNVAFARLARWLFEGYPQLPVSANQTKYESDNVVGYYDQLEGLQPTETYLFEKWIKPLGPKVLVDLGVGGGRTTPYLASVCERYVGIDYSKQMVDVCLRKWPETEFHVQDARDLNQLADASADVIVFSFNGLDVIEDIEGRCKSLAEIRRVLKSGGLFVFSTHNARKLIVLPSLKGADPARKLWRILRSILRAMIVVPTRILSPVYWRGAGFIDDPVHGGMRHYTCVPSVAHAEVGKAGFEVLEESSAPRQFELGVLGTPWFYFVCRAK